MCNNTELEVFDRKLSIGVPLPEKCIPSCCDLDLWPFDLKM